MQGQSSSARYAAGPRRPLVWNMHEAEITAAPDSPRIGFVQVGIEAGVDPVLVLAPLFQCFDDALGRYGDIKLSALQVTGVDFEPNEGSASGTLVSARNWFNAAREPTTKALIAVDNGSLAGRTEAELAADLHVIRVDDVVPLPPEHSIEGAAGTDGTFHRSFEQSGMALALTLPEWTASAAGWALGLVLDELRFGRSEVRDFRLRVARTS
jgi:hypothetical protein